MKFSILLLFLLAACMETSVCARISPMFMENGQFAGVSMKNVIGINPNGGCGR